MRLIRHSGQRIKKIIRVVRGRDVWPALQLRCQTVSMGNEHASWVISPAILTNASVVYSVGVGEDISFDLALIQRWGVQVHAFDPTPKSIEWVRSQNPPPQFVFHPYGVAAFDGFSKFLPPVDPTHVSHTTIERASPWPAIELPVRRLRTIMKSLGHSAIHLLKMDIEGSEYSVLSDMLASEIRVDQLLVEFHHRWPEIGIQYTRQALRDLRRNGYRIFYVSPTGEEYSFCHAPIG